MIQLHKLSLNSPDLTLISQINEEAFPENERVPVTAFFALNGLNVDTLGIYHEKQLVGFLVLMKKAPSAYIFYFAMDAVYRGQGIGGQALALLPELYPGLQIVVDYEALDDTAANPRQRERRRNFYLRNGYRPADLYMFYMDTEFEVAYSSADSKAAFNQTAFLSLINDLHRTVPEFDPEIYSK